MTRSLFLLLCIALCGCTHTKIVVKKLGDLPAAPQRMVMIDSTGGRTALYQPFYTAFEQSMQQCGVAVKMVKVDPLALDNDGIKNSIKEFGADTLLELHLVRTSRRQSGCEALLSFKLGSIEQRATLWSAEIKESGVACARIKTLVELAAELSRKLHQDGLLTSCSALGNRPQ